MPHASGLFDRRLFGQPRPVHEAFPLRVHGEIGGQGGGEVVEEVGFQCRDGERDAAVRKLWVTGSGGPFRERPLDTFETITRDEALRHYCFDLFCSRDEKGRRQCTHGCPLMAKTLQHERVQTRDSIARTRNGRDIWLSTTTLPVPQAGPEDACLVHLFRDVSRQKNLERSVSQLFTDVQPPATPPAHVVSAPERSHQALTLRAG